jgi:hypothetical protein
MKRIEPLAALLVLLLCAGAGPALAGGGDANLLFGQKSLSEDALDDAGVDSQSQFGVSVTLDFQWPVMLAIDYMSSSDDATRMIPAAFPLQLDTDVDTTELNLGVRKFWGADKIRPFVGGGLALVQLDARQTESGTLGPGAPFSTLIVDDDGSGIGLWINGGFLYRAGEHFNVGFDVRYSNADADLSTAQVGSDLSLDSGGIHYGVALGYHW